MPSWIADLVRLDRDDDTFSSTAAFGAGGRLFGGLIAWYSVHLVQSNYDLEATTVPLSMGLLYAPMVLAEGDYTVIAKNRDRIYQKDFTVTGGKNEDIEVIASESTAIDPEEGAD